MSEHCRRQARSDVADIETRIVARRMMCNTATAVGELAGVLGDLNDQCAQTVAAVQDFELACMWADA